MAPGAVLLVVGPSGSGKSTLARGLAGLLPAQFPGAWQGSLLVGGVDVARDDTARGASARTRELGAGIVLQDPASQLVMERVGDDVAFGLENLGWPIEVMRRRVPEALAAVGLEGYEPRRSTRLSGGEQQRVALAGVLAQAPGLLVLDEPTASLDPDGAAAVMAIVGSLRERAAATVVLVEHRAELAWPLADVVLALDADGRPLDVGPAGAVLERSGPTLDRAGIWLPTTRAGAARRQRPRLRARGAAADRPAEAGTPIGSPPIVELRNVRFGFEGEEPLLRDLDLAIGAGERVALVGANGSGKTTLLRLVLGLLRTTAGVVRLGARDPRRLSRHDIAHLAGYVVQDPELGFLADSVRDEVELGLAPADAAYARELCERLGLSLGDLGGRSPYRLSGGEQRRLSLVTGLARRPKLLALDEPTYGQDRRGHEALVAALAELVAEGSAMLAATHDERFTRDAAARRVELGGGWIVADEPVDAGPAARA